MDLDDDDATNGDGASDVELPKTKAAPKKNKTVTEQYQKVGLTHPFSDYF
jgi:hypothetical protein